MKQNQADCDRLLSPNPREKSPNGQVRIREYLQQTNGQSKGYKNELTALAIASINSELFST
jgi:hypothetical protein